MHDKMRHTLFFKTNKSPNIRFFKTSHRDEDDASTSDEGVTRQDFITQENFSQNRFRLLAPKKSLDEMLELLLRKAENSGPEACEFHLQQMLIFLKKNPDLVNRVPNKFHSNPLELAITLGYTSVIKELLHMQAQVRPHNKNLLDKIKYLLPSSSNTLKM
ncbi:MAG: hypothetical protein P4M12_06325 [Gammaproteobacteria bacterium]|nr:hypothetical protein [Gammaproteobacteria bacterium]